MDNPCSWVSLRVYTSLSVYKSTSTRNTKGSPSQEQLSGRPSQGKDKATTRLVCSYQYFQIKNLFTFNKHNITILMFRHPITGALHQRPDKEKVQKLNYCQRHESINLCPSLSLPPLSPSPPSLQQVQKPSKSGYNKTEHQNEPICLTGMYTTFYPASGNNHIVNVQGSPTSINHIKTVS